MSNITLKKDEYIEFEQFKKEIENPKYTEGKIRNLLATIMEQNEKLYEMEEKKETLQSRTINSVQIPENIPIISYNSSSKTEIEKTEMPDISSYIQKINLPFEELEELKEKLPARESENFTYLMNHMIAYLLKESYELKSFLIKEKNITEKDRQMFQEEISDLELKIRMLISYRDQKDVILEKKKRSTNNLIFLTSTSGNYYIHKDLKNIEPEYYSSFHNLFVSLMDGTYKGIKKLVNNNKMGTLYELKDYQSRVVFKFFNANAILIISMFVKKDTNPKYERDAIMNRIPRVEQFENDLVLTPHFLEEQKEITENLFDELKTKGVKR